LWKVPYLTELPFIATAVSSGFIDEIKVSDGRYIVRTKNPESEGLIKTIVILEDGA
jgi:hypothetical protein